MEKEKNIFEGAKFGDKFVTKDGTVAIFIIFDVVDGYKFILEDGKTFYTNAVGTDKDWMDNGHKNIVSKYQESIDEEKLDKLATKEAMEWYNPVKLESNYDFWRECFECYKAGYRKAKEE